jgi:hypothetical protein
MIEQVDRSAAEAPQALARIGRGCVADAILEIDITVAVNPEHSRPPGLPGRSGDVDGDDVGGVPVRADPYP